MLIHMYYKLTYKNSQGWRRAHLNADTSGKQQCAQGKGLPELTDSELLPSCPRISNVGLSFQR